MDFNLYVRQLNLYKFISHGFLCRNVAKLRESNWNMLDFYEKYSIIKKIRIW